MNKLLITIAAIVVLSACGGTSSSGSPSTTSSATPAGTAEAAAPADALKVSLVDFKINPDTFKAKPGDVTFAVSNDGKSPHNLTILDGDKKVVGKSADLAPGKTAVLKVTLAAGMYHINCSLPGHESLGMSGMVTVG